MWIRRGEDYAASPAGVQSIFTLFTIKGSTLALPGVEASWDAAMW
jgi:hypothetical protein